MNLDLKVENFYASLSISYKSKDGLPGSLETYYFLEKDKEILKKVLNILETELSHIKNLSSSLEEVTVTFSREKLNGNINS